MRTWVVALGAVAAIAALAPMARHLASAGVSVRPSQAVVAPAAMRISDAAALSGIQIERMQLGRTEATAPAAAGRVAHLTIDPNLQRVAMQLFRNHGVPEGGAVLLDVKTGKVLVYASQQDKAQHKDMCAEASAPAASVFKIITASALVEQARLNAQTRQCYHGGEERISSSELEDNPQHDRWCATLSEAMGRSINTVFAKLALKNLQPEQLRETASSFGFGAPVPFDLPVEASTLNLPEDRLSYARTAAGFWNSTLSPMQAVTMAAAVGSQGALLKPVLVSSVTDPSGAVVYRGPHDAQVTRNAIKPETAQAVREMMEATTALGTGYKAFHDTTGKPFLPGIRVAGKTGTLTRSATQQYYTWFVGFAPSEDPQVAVAALAVNRPKWQTRANVLARDLLRAYFASKSTPGVTMPEVLRVAKAGKAQAGPRAARH